MARHLLGVTLAHAYFYDSAASQCDASRLSGLLSDGVSDFADFIYQGEFNGIDITEVHNYNHLVVQGVPEDIVPSFQVEHISGSALTFKSRMAPKGNGKYEVTMEYTGCEPGAYSVVGVDILVDGCAFYNPMWKMQCPQMADPIRVVTADGVDLTDNGYVTLDDDQETLYLTVSNTADHPVTLAQAVVKTMPNAIMHIDGDTKSGSYTLLPGETAELDFQIFCAASDESTSNSILYPISLTDPDWGTNIQITKRCNWAKQPEHIL